MYPDNLRYTKEHEWLLVEGDIGTVGITDHAQEELGDIVYVDLPRAGAQLTQGGALGSVESVKAVSEIFSPAAGEVTQTNGDLADAPEKLNEDPYGAGWLVKLKLSDPAQAGSLMTAAEYQAYVGAENSCVTFRSLIPSAARCWMPAAWRRPMSCLPICRRRCG